MTAPPRVQSRWRCPHGWLIECPHCGKAHVHGPGEGHRLGHCLGNLDTPGYILVEPVEPMPDGSRCWRLGHLKGWLR